MMRLLPERVLYDCASRTLLVTDPHFGKAATFRDGGIPVPRGTTHAMLQRLQVCIDRVEPVSVIVLGDFFHARAGQSDEVIASLSKWRARNAQLDLRVVRGNHDLHAGDPPAGLDIACVDGPYQHDGLTLVHGHLGEDGHDQPQLAGHVHPIVVLRDRDRTRLRCPCFVFSDRRGILPAFGTFTGGHVIRRREWNRVFAIGPEAVIEVPGMAQKTPVSPSLECGDGHVSDAHP